MDGKSDSGNEVWNHPVIVCSCTMKRDSVRMYVVLLSRRLNSFFQRKGILATVEVIFDSTVAGNSDDLRGFEKINTADCRLARSTEHGPTGASL